MTPKTRLSIAVTWLAIQLGGCTGIAPVVAAPSSEVVQVHVTRSACEPVVGTLPEGFSTVAIALSELDHSDLERLLPDRAALESAREGCVYLVVLQGELMPGPPRRDHDGRLWHEQLFPRDDMGLPRF